MKKMSSHLLNQGIKFLENIFKEDIVEMIYDEKGFFVRLKGKNNFQKVSLTGEYEEKDL